MTSSGKASLATQLVAMAQSAERSSSAGERLSHIRYVLRQFSAVSVVEAAFARLQASGATIEVLQRRPWLVLLLVKMALQDRREYISIGPRIPFELFDQLNDELWGMTDPSSVGEPETRIYATLRAIWHAQSGFQSPHSWDFLRWPALVARLDARHIVRQQFVDAIQIEPEVFSDLALALYSAVLGNNFPVRRGWFAPLERAYGPSVERFLSLFVRDIHQLRDELSTGASRRLRGRREIFEFPYVKRFPLLKLRDGRIACWHPLVFARGVEEAAHLRLAALGERYTRPFSRVFEKYVLELLAEAGHTPIVESDIKSAAGANSPAVEAIIEAHGANVLVEAKMGLFAEEVMVEDDAERLAHKTARVREAIAQGWNVSRLLRSGTVQLGTTSGAGEDFLLVVTSRELNIGTGSHLQMMLPEGRLAYPDDWSAQVLPLERVFVLAIDDFERLCAASARGEVDIIRLLREAVADNRNHATAKWFFDQHLAGKASRTPGNLICAARANSEHRLRSSLA